MIEVKKPVTMLEYLSGKKKITAKRIDFLKGDQDALWETSDKKATKIELTQAREDMGGLIAEKADASEITTINETLAGKAEQSEVDSLSKDIAGKADIKWGKNLIENGYGELGDNTNFPGFTYRTDILDPLDPSIGAFSAFGNVGAQTTLNATEYIKVDPNSQYRYSFKWRNLSYPTLISGVYAGFRCYDKFKNLIDYYCVPSWVFSQAEKQDGLRLTQDWHPDDDHIHIDKPAKWAYRMSKAGYQYGGYLRIGSKIKEGFDFGFEISAYHLVNMYGNNTSDPGDGSGWMDLDNGIIYLCRTRRNATTNSTLRNSVLPSGTKIDNNYNATGWGLWILRNTNLPYEWTEFSSIFDETHRYFFHAGTEYIKPVFIIDNNQKVGSEIAFCNFRFENVHSNLAEVKTTIEEERPDSSYKNSNILEADIPALPQSKITDLDTALEGKASQGDFNNIKDDVSDLQTSVATKASASALDRTTLMDIYGRANLQSFIIGPTYSTATAFCTELGLFLEIKTPVWLSQTKLYMKEADKVLVQIYNYENDVVVYEKSFSCNINENILSLGVLLPAGRYYFSGTADNETLAYFPTTDYTVSHHFVSVFGGELDPVAFPTFTPGTTTQWAGFYQISFHVSTKALYLGILGAKESNNNLITGAFYHVNDSGKLLTWCYDGTTQISN